MAKNISVGNDTECSEDDDDGNVDLDLGDFDSDHGARLNSQISCAKQVKLQQLKLTVAPPADFGYSLTSISLIFPVFST